MSDAKEPKDVGSSYVALGISFGVSLGAGFGVVFDNIALGVGIGTSLGICLGSVFAANAKRKQDAEQRDADGIEK